MSLHKQKLLASSSGMELRSVRVSHQNPFPGSSRIDTTTPQSSMCSPGAYRSAHAVNSSQEDNRSTVAPFNLPNTPAFSDTADKNSSGDDELHFRYCGHPEGCRGPSSAGDSHNSSTQRQQHRSSTEKNEEVNRHRGIRTHSGLSEDFLSSIHSGPVSENLLDSYGVGDLTDDWKVGYQFKSDGVL